MESGTKTLIILGAAAGALGLIVWLSRRATVAAVTEAGVLACDGWEECAKQAAWEAEHPGQDYYMTMYHENPAELEKLIQEGRTRRMQER